MTKVADGKGQMIDIEDVRVEATEFYNFVHRHRKDYFDEEWSMSRCLLQIVERGKSEIDRQVKTAAKQRENAVAGDLMRKYNLTVAEANAVLSAAKQHGDV
jgi:hypothetical protein